MTGKRSIAEEHLDALRTVAPFIEQQMQFDQALTNSLIDRAWGEAELWATRFRDLMAAVGKANDSVRVDRILGQHWQPDMQRTIDHYRKMQGRGEEAN